MAYSELIKNFESIREYMREFYVFGFRNRDEVGSKSARSYDNERRRIESWLGEYMSFHQDSNGRAQFLSVDTRSMNQNPLYQAFKAKSFTDNDLILHFFLLDMLDEEWMGFREIVDGLYDNYFSDTTTEVDMDETTIRNKLKEYVELGLIERRKVGKAFEYRRSIDTLELESFKEAIAFFTEANPLGVVGSYIQDKEDMSSDTFLFKHQYMLYALDSEILYHLLDAISKHRIVEIKVKGTKKTNISSMRLLPMRIYVSASNGREHVLAFDYLGNHFTFVRLDNIRSVKLEEPESNWDDFEEKYIKFSKNQWGLSRYQSKDRSLDHVEMTIHIEPYEEHIINRLEREKRNGSVIKIDEETYKYVVDTRDAYELMPWIRTFICRIVKLESTNEVLVTNFYDDLDKLIKMYEVDDAIQ